MSRLMTQHSSSDEAQTNDPQSQGNHKVDTTESAYLKIVFLIPQPKLIVRTKKLIFLFFNQNICCGYTKEPSQ